MQLAAGAKVGPYRIVDTIGSGGMATVYRAYQPALDRVVAIKVLPDFLAERPGFKERFRREAVAVARLRHPSILSVFDHGEADGLVYIVSEFVGGGTLAQRLGSPIPIGDVVRQLAPLADALDYAHAQGIVHRDVKPANVLLGANGTPILGDFGVAQVDGSEERLTASGVIIGTPEYMSPEQCMGKPMGSSSDLYSLAVVAYEMVTGEVPFQRETPVSVALAQIQQPPPPARDRGRGRDRPCGRPPAQIPASGAAALGSCLGWMT